MEEAVTKEYLTIPEAKAYLEEKGIERTEGTIKRWCKEQNIGHQIGEGKMQGEWVVRREALDEFVFGGAK